MGHSNVDTTHRVVLDSYRSYDAAQHAVDILAESRFPVELVKIVGTNLRTEEHVIGRWTPGRALVAGVGPTWR
jgi:hypothetical protein